MAPIKFEEQLKEKLEKRTLSPSAEGWTKLSDRLDADNKKNRKPIYWWLSIAAMLVIMIAITVQVFNKEETTSVAPQIVNEELNEIKNDKEDAIFSNDKESELVSEENTLKDEVSDRANDDKPVNAEIKKLVKSNPESKTQLAANTDNKEAKALSAHDQIVKEKILNVNKPIIDENAVAVALENVNTSKEDQLNREVDSLLKLASKELTKNKFIKEGGKTVDANALLEDVQDEMGQSFRSKVYEALKDSYKTVKTAVAQRNN